MRLPFGIIAALCALSVARTAALFPALPLRIASHFDAQGKPNGYMSREQFVWGYGCTSALAIALLLVIPWFTRALPSALINIPNRGYWLTPERRALVDAKLSAFGAWFAVGLTVFLCALLELVLRANLGAQALAPQPFMALIAAFTLGSLFGMVWLIRAFRLPPGYAGGH